METSLFGEYREQDVLWSAGIDWLTMTWKPDDNNAEKGEMLAHVIGQQRAKEGFPIRTTWLRDYHGWKSNGILWGARADGYICVASSSTADALTRLFLVNGCGGKPTRIDFQVTCRHSTDDPERAAALRKAVRAFEKQKQRKATARLFLVEDYRGGCSIGIGNRISESYLRAYDKTREQRRKIAERLWRYEVEYKGKRAVQSWQALQDAKCIPSLSRGIVASEFSIRGLSFEWIGKTLIHGMPSCYTPTSNEKKLAWFEKYVRSTFQSLRNDGLEEQALDALGFWSDTLR